MCESFEYIFCCDCFVCKGCGMIKMVEMVCYEILCEIVWVYYLFNIEKVWVYVLKEVVEYLINEESYVFFVEFEVFIGKKVEVKLEFYYY